MRSTTGNFNPKSSQFKREFNKSLNGTRGACFACGQKGHWKGDSFCRAKTAKCLKCNGIGHFVNRCLKRPSDSQINFKPKRVRLIEEESEQPVNEIFYAMGDNTFEFVVGGVKIPMIIDSGADANVITEETWIKVKGRGISILEYTGVADRKLVAYATNMPMNILGMFRAVIQAGKNQVEAKFYTESSRRQDSKTTGSAQGRFQHRVSC